MYPTHPTQQNMNDRNTNFVNVKMPAPGFVLFILKDAEKTMQNINPFYIQIAVGGEICSMNEEQNSLGRGLK
jgi:hypothetical protein